MFIAPLTPKGKFYFTLCLLSALLLPASAFAEGDCASDMQKLALRRQSAMKVINNFVASAHNKKLDPAGFCTKSHPLNAAEESMLAYMIKNKDWCQIPDEAIANFKTSHAKNVAFAAKACSVAAQIERVKKQAEEAQKNAHLPPPQPLPTGPL